MIEIPREFPLPEETFERQRSLLTAHIKTGWQSSRLTRTRVVVVATAILVGGLLVTPALGIGSRLLDLIQGSPPPRETREPAWSPDGRKIAFRGRRTPDASRGLWVINADGSGKRRLAPQGWDPAWSPDGRTIAFAARVRIWVVNADGTGQRALAGKTVAGSRTGGSMSSLAWSPDGRKVLFLSDAGNLGDFCFHVYVVNADGSGERRLTHNATPGPPKLSTVRCNFAPAWSPDGQRIAFVRRRFDPTGLDVGVVWVMRADGREQRKLTREMSFAERGPTYARVAWSPDGRKLAFTSNRDGNAEVYTINSDGSGLRRLTDNPEYDGDATWSPDGRKLLFVSNRDGNYGVYVMNADGSGQRRLTQRGS